MLFRAALVVTLACLAPQALAQTNPLWREEKVRNFLPHMTWPEVRDLLTRTDMVLIPVPSIEQHGPQTPSGTDFYIGVEQSKLIAQRTDILVAPVLMAGQSPYHMEFPGTITLTSETIQRVYFETAQSLIRHGFRRFLFLNSHAGNQYITRFVVDRINQETPAVAIELGDGVEAITGAGAPQAPGRTERVDRLDRFDCHGGVGETSRAM
jgi:creatinine amidohydrolase